jgi:hypothetical protein
MDDNNILKWWALCMVAAGLAVLLLMGIISNAEGAEYETYFGDKFLIYHEGELGQIYIDTMIVISKTERGSEIYLRGENGNIRIIKPPDYVEKVGQDE